jgi:hypothetical protein
MSLSRTALVLGFLLLNACGTVTASSGSGPSTPAGGAGRGPEGNTPSSPSTTRPVAERSTFSSHHAEPRSFSASCRHCY